MEPIDPAIHFNTVDFRTAGSKEGARGLLRGNLCAAYE